MAKLKSESFETKSFEINLMLAFHLHLRHKQTANRQLAVIEIQCKSMVICHTGVENALKTGQSRARGSVAGLEPESGALRPCFPPQSQASFKTKANRARHRYFVNALNICI